MKGLLVNSRNSVGWLSASLVVFCAPANAKVSIAAMPPALKPPQQIGAIVRWTATARGANSGPLTFQWVRPPIEPGQMPNVYSPPTT